MISNMSYIACGCFTWKRPETPTTKENIEEVNNMILDEQYLKLYEIANYLGMSSLQGWYRIHYILIKNKWGNDFPSSVWTILKSIQKMLGTDLLVWTKRGCNTFRLKLKSSRGRGFAQKKRNKCICRRDQGTCSLVCKRDSLTWLFETKESNNQRIYAPFLV